MEQEIRFVTTSDGARIAYSVLGDGPPLVVSPGIYSHVESEFQIPRRRRWWETLGRSCRIYRYDKRGSGLSQRGDFAYTLDTLITDLEAVVNHAGLERFPILGLVLGGAGAIGYAARYPERVERMVLSGTANRGPELYEREALAPLLQMARSNWQMASVLASNLATGTDMNDEERRLDEQFVREAVDGETFARLLELSYSLDLTPLLESVTMPALVIHQRNDRVVPAEYGQKLAASLPNARFQMFEGDSSLPHHGPGEEIARAITTFLDLAPATAASDTHTFLVTDIETSTALTRRLGDERAQELLRKHNSVVRGALKEYGGTEIRHRGDGIMASFPSARSALEAAVAIQRNMNGGSGESDGTIRVRIGLNAGEPVAEGRELVGAAVQLAVGVCGQARPGEIVVSNVVRELAAGKGFRFEDRGETALAGFDDGVRLFEVGWR